MGAAITVLSGGLPLTVSITPAGGVFTNAALTVAATFPATIVADTTYFVRPGRYTVSAKYGGQELADANGTSAIVDALFTTPITVDAPGHLTLLREAIGGGTVFSLAQYPSYVGARAKSWNPSSSLYNGRSDNMQKIRALIASTRNGGTCRITFIGDSQVAGSGATGGVGSFWPTQLRSRLATSGCAVRGTGLCFAGQGISSDTRWSQSGTITDFGSYSQLTAAATKTFVSDIAGTKCDIWFYANSGSFSITVDGAAPANGNVTMTNGTYNLGTITPSGASVVGKIAITGLASTTHTVVVTAGGTTFLIGVDVYGAAGLEVNNVGVAATKASDWTATGFVTDFQQATTTATNDAFILGIGINDSAAAVAVATFKSNMQTIITNLVAIAPVMLWVPENSGAITAAAHQPYASALYDLADTNDLPLIDFFHRWSSYSTANALGLMADNVHPNNFGYADWAQAFYGVLDS